MRCLDGGSEDPLLPWPAPWTAGGSDSCNNYGHSAICSPSLVGVSSVGDRGRVERFIGRLRRSRYLPKEAPTAAEMVNEAEAHLFRSVRCDSRHVLKKHLPPPKVH